ncbi:ATP-grasp ribosomal peptide maturase [Streptomyces daliensis]|uniref:ATP-grasp ribosomal peptide maturase n=1 Tax=Streptomyces daliensis TaxID=299421 RepID=A0A8T4ITZ1_9ACTN|nr:ATP-grasp ribosomal peptide maturase [Streptomyces daliensis]
MSPEQAEWASGETNAGLAGLLASLPDCLQVNHPSAAHRANSKISVLVQAQRAGLEVPPTWIGNTPSPARAFAEQQGKVVCKSLTRPDITYDSGERSFFPTTPVPAHRINEQVAAHVHQLQHAVEKAFEVRLTVIGRHMFAVRIDAHSTAAQADWRTDPDARSYRVIDLPATVRHGVAALLDHYCLRYAALDLLVQHDGRWLLVDLNTAGQYGWLETALPDLRISQALAAFLARHTDPAPAAEQPVHHASRPRR